MRWIRSVLRRAAALALGCVLAGALLEGVLQVAARAGAPPTRGVPSPATPGAAGTIVCCGDSHTYGTGLKPEESWPARLAERLAADPSGAWSVHNAGVPGRNSAEVALELDALLARHAPSVALVWIGVNDSWSLAGAEVWDAAAPNALQRLAARSRALRLLRIAWLRAAEHGAEGRAAASVNARSAPVAPELHRARTERALQQIEATCAAHGVRTLYVTYAADTPAARDGANAALRAHAARVQAPLLDLEREFLPLAERHGYHALFVHDWHPNALSCLEIARLVQTRLVERGWIAARPADAPREPPLAERLAQFEVRELERGPGRLVLELRGAPGLRWRPRLAALYEPDPDWDRAGAAAPAVAEWERRLRRARGGGDALRVLPCSAEVEAGALGPASLGGTLPEAGVCTIELRVPAATTAAALPRQDGERLRGWRVSVQGLDPRTDPPTVHESRRFDL
jgi:lysophospholipase L1-like esterase